MTADEWEPSEKLLEIAASILVRSDNCIDFFVNAIKAVRPLLIAEARPQIEAEERERIAKHIADEWHEPHLAAMVRGLNMKKAPAD